MKRSYSSKSKNVSLKSKVLTNSGLKVTTVSSRSVELYTKRRLRVNGVGTFITIFGIIIAILLFATVLGVIFNPDTPVRTFDGLLRTLENFESIDIRFVYNVWVVELGDWGAFNFLKDFINLFVQAFKYLTIIGAGAINCLTGISSILLYFLGF